ncbi:MAG: Gfo/Idh/MocA family oxidoreductase [Phycisphaerales bacterium]|nr:Gfo/Idh/MocA family oxidoreductase [Phycisphaerales bacterium]
MSDSTIGVGVIGMGFMGATHIKAYQAAAADGFACALVAVSDPNPQRLTGAPAGGGNIGPAISDRLFDPAVVRGYERADDLLADAAVSLVSICTPTDTHVDLAIAALQAGKHVLLEKPVALASSDVARLVAAARNANTLCMPAMCMRFWPGWTFLREACRDARYGKLRALSMHRLGSGPTWSKEFYKDVARSGGALVDQHIHDTDFVVHLLGAPTSVRSSGGPIHLQTIYDFPSMPGVSVSAEGSWAMDPAFGYRMRYLAAFERATVEFDLVSTPTVTIYADGARTHPPLPPGTGYDGQVRHLLSAIASASRNLDATVNEAVTVARVLEAELRSTQTGAAVSL